MPKVIPDCPPWETAPEITKPAKTIPDRPPWETAAESAQTAPLSPAPGPDKAEAIRELHLKAQERQVGQRQEAAMVPPSDPREGIPAMESYIRACEGRIKDFQKAGDQDGVARWTKQRDDHQVMVEQMRRGEKPIHPDRQPGLLDQPASEFSEDDELPDACGAARGNGEYCSLMKGHEGDHDAGNPETGSWSAILTGEDMVPDPMTGKIEPDLPAMGKGEPQVMALAGTPETPQTAPPAPPQGKILHPAVIDPSPVVAPFQQQAQALVVEFQSLAITDQATLDKAGELRKRAKKLKDQVTDVSKSWTDPLTSLVTRLRGIFKGPIDFLDNLVRQIDAQILEYHRKEEERRKAAEKAARDAQEAAAKAAAEKAVEDAQAMREALPGEQGEAVAQLIEQGGQKQAQAIQAAPVYVAPAARPSSGAGFRKTWTYKVVDIKELCRAVADGKVPENYVTVNGPIITTEIRGGKRAVPGLEIFQQEGVTGR